MYEKHIVHLHFFLLFLFIYILFIFCLHFTSILFIFYNRWFERWKERNQIHFSFGQWLGSVEECCTNKNGKYVQNTGLKIDKNSFAEQEQEESDGMISGINTETAVTLNSIVNENKIESNNKNQKVEDNENLGKCEKRKFIDTTGDKKEEEEARGRGLGLEVKGGSKKHKSSHNHNAEEAAMTAGINAVKCQRNGKKGTAPFQYNKVRQACLKIPLVYSHRTQRLPPFSSTSTFTSSNSNSNNSNSNNSNNNNSSNNSNSNSNNDKDVVEVEVEVEVVAAQCKSKEIKHNVSDSYNCDASYYFPSTDSDKWLCIFKPETN